MIGLAVKSVLSPARKARVPPALDRLYFPTTAAPLPLDAPVGHVEEIFEDVSIPDSTHKPDAHIDGDNRDLSQ
jgi:hypothetical protein